MTEDDAKNKWCPQARVLYQAKTEFGAAFAAANAFKVDNSQETRTNCIGSACMYGCDADGKWRGHCGLAPLPIAPDRIIYNRTPPKIGGHVGNNQQPGDPDHPGGG